MTDRVLEIIPSVETAMQMTLRDYFAACALQGLIANSWSVALAPQLAYDYADAMLKVRAPE